MLAAVLATRRAGPSLFVAADEGERQNTFHDLQSLLSGEEIGDSSEETRSGSGGTKIPVSLLLADAQSQLRLLALLQRGGRCAIVTDAETLKARAIRPPAGRALELALQTGTELRRDVLLDWLADSGFERVDLVTENGEFSARGGIVRSVSGRRHYPVRVEFLGDRVESMRHFDPLTQRSIQKLDSARVSARNAHELSEATIGSLLSSLSGDTIPIEAIGSCPLTLVLEATPTDLVTRTKVRIRADRSVRGHDPESDDRFGSCPRSDVNFGMERATIYLGNFALLKSEVASTRNLVLRRLRR